MRRARTYRAGWSRSFPIAIGVFSWCIGLGVLVIVPEVPAKLGIAAVNFGIAAFFIFRFAALGPRLNPEGVKIVRPFSTRNVPWSEVRTFVVRIHPGSGYMAHLVRTDGTMIWLQGVGSSNVYSSRPSAELESTVDRMNAERRRYQREAGITGT